MLDPREAIDRINDIYGRHPHHRALHARGAFYTGTFTATPEATALCAAEPFSGSSVPVLVRWSNGAGNPQRPDQDPDVRGMAVKFQAPGGDADLLGQTSPRFPVRTPEEFISMTAAAQRQATFPLWVIRRPATVPALIAGLRARALGPPYSYAEVSYYPIHA
jgi:catalase